MMEMRIILGTLIQNVDVNILDGFEPDLVPELSLNPGERGMRMRVRFRAPHGRPSEVAMLENYSLNP